MRRESNLLFCLTNKISLIRIFLDVIFRRFTIYFLFENCTVNSEKMWIFILKGGGGGNTQECKKGSCGSIAMLNIMRPKYEKALLKFATTLYNNPKIGWVG